MPPLRLDPDSPLEMSVDSKARVLRQGIFPEIGSADLSDLVGTKLPRFHVGITVTTVEIEIQWFA
jgi:hypothetical protein